MAYLEISGKQSTKYWITCQEDLDMMIHWEKEKPNILLWCDGRSTDSLDSSDSPLSCGCKRKSPPVSEPLPSKRQQLDDSIANTVKELKEKHGSKYTFPQLRSSDAMSSPVKSNSSLSVHLLLEFL